MIEIFNHLFIYSIPSSIGQLFLCIFVCTRINNFMDWYDTNIFYIKLFREHGLEVSYDLFSFTNVFVLFTFIYYSIKNKV